MRISETGEAVAAEILRQTAGREGSLCPSEVARALAPTLPDGSEPWRGLMPAVRREAARLARAGAIDILRKGRAVDPDGEIKGVIRLRARR